MSWKEYLALENEFWTDYIRNILNIKDNEWEYDINLNKKYASIIENTIKQHPEKEKLIDFFGWINLAKDFTLKLINAESWWLTFIHAGDIWSNNNDIALGPLQHLEDYREEFKVNPFDKEQVIQAKMDQIIRDFFMEGGELHKWKDHPNRINIAYQAHISWAHWTKLAINDYWSYWFSEHFADSSYQQTRYLDFVEKQAQRAINKWKLVLNENNNLLDKFEDWKENNPKVALLLSDN